MHPVESLGPVSCSTLDGFRGGFMFTTSLQLEQMLGFFCSLTAAAYHHRNLFRTTAYCGWSDGLPETVLRTRQILLFCYAN